MKFLWEKDNITFEGQDDTELLESEIRLRIINESLGIIRNIIQCVSLTCHSPLSRDVHVSRDQQAGWQHVRPAGVRGHPPRRGAGPSPHLHHIHPPRHAGRGLTRSAVLSMLQEKKRLLRW